MSNGVKQCVYHVSGYDGSFMAYIGQRKSVCRFCGKSIPNVKFKKKAHALSESIGTKYIINNEECDSCNEAFSYIEQDFYNRHAALLSLYNVKGKNGSRKIKTETVDIFDQYGIITIEPHKADNVPFKEITKGKSSFDFSLVMKYNPHKPQNVYKCLVKYALSIIESQYVPKFANTISWITNEKLFVNRLPNVIHYSTTFHSHPRAAVFTRKDDNLKFPYAFAIVEFANIGYCFILPFGNNEPITESSYNSLIAAFLQLSNGANFYPLNLSNPNKIISKVNFTIDNLDKGTAISLPYPVTPEVIQELKEKNII
ncbi:MAG: hypothetical protein K2N05_07375 [Muribaculaceae bacterium]|nr:hypothetical protein [Muribaculaceae bacterium]